jgi:MFS family permease
LAAAILVPNSLALLSHTYADEKARGRAVAVWAAGASRALTAGPFVGGALFGSLVSQSGTFMAGFHAALMIAAGVLIAGAAAIWFGRPPATGSNDFATPDQSRR